MGATEIQKAYAAGLIDGEGCITVEKNNIIFGVRATPQYFVKVGVHITNIQVLYFLKEIWGGVIRECKKYAPHHKQSYQWIISSTRAINFLKDIFPYTIIKSKEVKVAVKFIVKSRGRNKLTEQELQARIQIKEELENLKKEVEYSGSHCTN